LGFGNFTVFTDRKVEVRASPPHGSKALPVYTLNPGWMGNHRHEEICPGGRQKCRLGLGPLGSALPTATTFQLESNADKRHLLTKSQKNIGSLLYAAVVTRPDIAFAVSLLARFLTNPGPTHHRAADRVILYLKSQRTLALQFGGAEMKGPAVMVDDPTTLHVEMASLWRWEAIHYVP